MWIDLDQDGSKPREPGELPGNARELLKRAAVPGQMQHLQRDRRGYPVPAFVAWSNGVPDFRVVNTGFFARAIKHRLCWLCGGRLGRNMAFVVGPMCVINRVSSEPPSHLDCALYAVQVCPFLAIPEMRRPPMKRADVVEPPGLGLSRNPGAAAVYVTRSYELMPVADRGKQRDSLLLMGDPDTVRWYARGSVADGPEVLDALRRGLPALVAMAAAEADGAMAALERQVVGVLPWVPGRPKRAELGGDLAELAASL